MKYYLWASIAFFSFNSFAQNYSPVQLEQQRLNDRLNKMENNLNILQKQFYKNGKAPASFDNYDDASPNTQVRIDEIEEKLRDLMGKIEQNQFNITNALKQIQKVSQDIDFRLSEMEKKQTHNSLGSNINSPAPNTNANDKKEPELVGKLENATRESVAPIDENDQYDKAFMYLRNAEYDKAESMLKAFIDNNAESSLISNAYYWLGETFYVRENFEQSAVNFLKGYQKLPKGNKAADNLLKLAMSLNKMNKKKEACTTFTKLEKEFPEAEKAIKDKVSEEKKAINCS
ncbi:MAG: tol-pal system protein YbgF [Rickettsiales bacterium]|nr:tol-pal system protein YbgF [Pseudomonadota bacterium]MDA0965667.1 tol-pal system protein YbgF [Pseudomonadota bacterium]MDG4542991.1 tol-pal system protein YbgF [Rickettsiales bacterium]MDG4544561.1 tol-pal system protein YbgF [Rickettsiales bacterium]MDG4546683.1 tol-pal system protein YbgF [Rickettsiales bacterium]